jgi:Uma2 family endonuclease
MREPATYRRHLTFEEFLAIEADSDTRHEYVGGVLHAMAGASRRHNAIAGNIITALGVAAEDSTCSVFPSDMLIKAADDVAYYPDVSVVCDPDDAEERYTERPCLVVEITSPSTVSADRRDKLMAYRRIETLQAYLIVFQDERRIVRHFRDAKGAWWEEDIIGDGAIRLHCPDTTLTMNRVYRGVEFT